MHMRKIGLLVVLMFNLQLQSAAEAGRPLWYPGNSADQIVQSLIDRLDGYKLVPLAISIATLYAASTVQKMNPEFFASVVRMAKFPVVFLQKKAEILVCSGESLSWNVVASWHNRVTDALSPLAKQPSVAELTKEKRIQVLDAQAGEDNAVTRSWESTRQHICKEFSFMGQRFNYHLRYYQEPGKTVLHKVAQSCVRLSIKRHEETAFYIQKVIQYCDELCLYINAVASKDELDRELIKRIMEDLCSACKHLSVLVDDATAAAPHGSPGKIQLGRSQGSQITSSSYAGAYGSYGAGNEYGAAAY